MAIDSNLLKIFTVVSKSNSLTEGAKKLKMTQANVTLRIKQLEKILGFKVFHRLPKGVILTTEGKALLPLAVEIEKKFEKIDLYTQNISQQNSLIFASTYSNASKRLIPILKQLRLDYPQLKLSLVTDNKIPVIQLLYDYKIDIGFVNHIPNSPDVIVLKQYKNSLLYLEPKNSQDNNTMLAYDDDCAFYTGTKKYYEQIGIHDYDVIKIADYEIMLSCIELGMGKSIIPEHIVRKLGYMDKLKITQINDETLSIPTCLICRKDNIPKVSEYLKNINID